MSDIGIKNSQDSEALSGTNSVKVDFIINDTERQRLYNQLEKYNSNAAAAYKGALYNLNSAREDNPDRFRQAAHSLRMLPGLIMRSHEFSSEKDCEYKITTTKKSSIDKKPIKIFEVAHDQLKDCQDLNKTIEDLESKVFVSGNGMIEKIKNKIIKDDPRGGAPVGIMDAVLKQLTVSHNWFNGISKSDNPQNEITDTDFYNKLGALEEVLFKLTSNYFDIRDEIKKILAEKPSKELAQKLIHKIVFWRNFEYLFQQATSEWLTPLYEVGFFCMPGNNIREWPPTKYLMRICDKKQKESIEIIKFISNTENPVVMSDFLDIALKIDPKLSVQVVSIVYDKKWRKNGYLSNYWLGHSAIKLVDYLAGGGEIEAAIRLFRHLLEYRIVKKQFGVDATETVIRDFDYQELLEKNIEQLIRVAPLDTVKIISILLKATYSTLCYEGNNYLKERDCSYFDYKNVDGGMNYSRDARTMLLRSLVVRMEQIVESGLADLSQLLMMIDYPVRIFQMIKFRMFNKFSDKFKEQIQACLIDMSNYDSLDDYGVSFMELLRDNYDALSNDDKAKILTISEEHPDHIKNLKDCSIEEVEQFYQNWKYKILFCIRDYLGQEKKDWVLSFSKTKGAPEYGCWSTNSWVGPTSDLSVEYFNSTSICVVVEELISWVPPKGFGVDSVEGRGRNLSESIKQLPSKYCEASPLFINSGLHFTYIHHLFWGLELAIRDGHKLNWWPIIEAADKFVSLSKEEIQKFPEKNDDFAYDYDGVLRAIISLIDQGLNQAEVEIKQEQRDSIWKIIKKGLQSKNPDLKHEKKYGGNNTDPYTMSINTTRGEAMHALVKYASWVANKIEKKRGLAEEVMEKLKFHLVYENEPTETIHCLYGFYFPFIYYHEKSWVIENLEVIFPRERKCFLVWKATFSGYLYRGMYIDLFPLLINQYKRGIKHVESLELKEKTRDAFSDKLSEHIMLAVAHGAEGAEEIAKLMLESKNEDIVKHAIFYAGANILKTELKNIEDEKIPNPENLRWVWESMLEKISIEAAKGFGWWFANSPYDAEFTIKQLLKTLKFTSGQLDDEHKINEELSKYVDDFPIEVVKCVELIIKNDDHGWHLSYRINDYSDLFRRSLVNNKPGLREKISKLADYLGKKGFDAFEEFVIR